MMKFRNRNSGIVLEMPDNFSGANWEPVEKPAPVAEKPKTKKTSVKKTVKK